MNAGGLNWLMQKGGRTGGLVGELNKGSEISKVRANKEIKLEVVGDIDNDDGLRRSWAGGITGFAADGSVVKDISLNSVSINSAVLTRSGAVSGEIVRGCDFRRY